MRVLEARVRETREVGNRWLAEVPAEWSITRLRFICDVETGSGDTQDAEPDGEYDFYVRSQVPLRSTGFTFDAEAILTAGDGAVGEVFHHVRGRFHAHQRVYVLTNFRDVLPRYFFYYFSSFFRLMAQDGSARTTVDSVRRWMLTDMPFVLPPLDEQCIIADYLDRETAQIDALVAKQEEFIELLRERRQSQISDIFASLGSPNTQLRRVAHIQTGITLSGGGNPSHPQWPYLRVANVQMGRVDLSHVKEIHLPPAEATTSLLRAGDVLMTEGGDIDKLGRGTVWDGSIERMVHQNHVFAVRAKPARLVPAFLAWWLDSSIAREYFYLTAKKTTNLASTNKTVVGRLPIHIPEISRQDEIVTQISEQTLRIDALIAKAEEHITLAKERRSALITAAVTGQFDVRTAEKGARV
ncbi:restriction endonuclease subunit S [Glutamicibacter sp.]|uniref:restriction endonuclease subunit S n=1 Tax=Glutamicibacter sp. TaxID=1931995 RepID=UPI002FE3EC7C